MDNKLVVLTEFAPMPHRTTGTGNRRRTAAHGTTFERSSAEGAKGWL